MAKRTLRAHLGLIGLAAILLALPAQALANQTLTVERKGAGTGTVTSSPAGINCGSTCSFAFADSTVVTLSANPGVGSQAVGWSGCDTVTAEDKCKVTMSGAKAITATFALAKPKLTVSKAGTGTGTVTSSPAGIQCGATCAAEYESGAEVTLSGAPGANTEAVKWAGCASVDGEGHCKVTMSAAKAVSATFNLRKQELKVTRIGTGTGTVTSSPAGISCGVSCAASFGEGSTVTLTGTPTGEALPVKWSGCDSVNGEGRCLVAMSALREVSATFDLPSFALTVAKTGNGTGTVTSSPAGIECGATCSASYVKGQSVTLKGAAGLHTQAVKWAGCDKIVGANECQVSISAARGVSAAFLLEPQWTQYTITLAMIGTGKGTVTSVPTGIECPGECSGEYLFKSSLTLFATPAPGSVFDHWSIGACGSSTLCTTQVRSARRVNAVFTAVGKRTLTVSKAGSGTGTVVSKPAGIECGATCSADVDAATKVVLKATVAKGSKFKGFTGEGCEGKKSCRMRMNEARNVTATFEKLPGPAAAQCVVPSLKGKTLAKARNALAAANCALGKVRKPKGARLHQLRVRFFTPAAGTVLAAGSEVALKLARVKRR
jgi:hypothetical protein